MTELKLTKLEIDALPDMFRRVMMKTDKTFNDGIIASILGKLVAQYFGQATLQKIQQDVADTFPLKLAAEQQRKREAEGEPMSFQELGEKAARMN